MNDFIPLTRPAIDQAECDAVVSVLQSGRLVQGDRVLAFESAVVSYTGARHAVAVTNCTSALQLALLALGLRPGDRVVVAAFSWISTANVIVQCGAIPVFVDIDPAAYNMDPKQLLRVLEEMHPEERKRVKAILPVHTFGQMADMTAMMAVSEHYNIPVIEDAACALGATFEGKQAGRWGMMGCFSFHPRKAITTGEGGMIVTDDARLARRLRALRNHGMRPGQRGMEFVCPGYNCRMTEMQAAIGCVQMGKLDRIIKDRRQVAEIYRVQLGGTGCLPPATDVRGEAVYQSYVIRLPASFGPKRSELLRSMKADGIEATIGTYNMPGTRWLRRFAIARGQKFPEAEAAYRDLVSLPIYAGLQPAEQERVVASLGRALIS